MARLNLSGGKWWSFKTKAELKELLSGATYTQVGKMLSEGKVTEAELKKYYKGALAAAEKRQQRSIEAGLAKEGQSVGLKPRNITSVMELVRNVADVNKYLKAPTTVKQRTEVMNKALKTMHNRGMFKGVNKGNFNQFTRFMDWARAAGVLKTYSSESDVIEETVDAVISTGASTAAEFQELFDMVIESGV